MNFKDHFSQHSKVYAEGRPTYPANLFKFLSQVSPSRKLAWDCATGNGQAAQGLAEFFDLVVATDASAEQIQLSKSIRNIEYRVGLAEDSGLENDSVDLVTVATAIHWFDLNQFYSEARRVCREGGILAAWLYEPKLAIDQSIDPIIENFISLTMPYFPLEAQKNWSNGYDWIEFPFKEINAPTFSEKVHWSLDSLLNYAKSWSGTQKYIQVKGIEAWNEFSAALQAHWPQDRELLAHEWFLRTRIGVCK